MTTKKLKPFNLEAAKDGAAVITREGLDVRIICFDSNVKCNNIEYPIVALFPDCEGDETYQSFTEYGYCLFGKENPEDLFMAPVKRSGYLNIYPGSANNSTPSHLHKTLEEAEQNSGPTRIDCVKVEWQE